MIKKLFAFIIELPDNLNWEMLCFAGQRVSGIALALYLIPHIFVASTATVFSPKTFTQVMAFMHKPYIVAGEVLLFAAVFAHMLNGIRITIGDLLGLTKIQRKIFAAIAAIGFVIVCLGGSLLVYNYSRLLIHN